MKKVLYIHGLSSSGASSSASTLRTLLPEATVLSPDLPVNPAHALEMLHKLCIEEKPDIVIGTSMGGMFAQQMHGFKKIIVNPAFHVSNTLRRNIGIQKFLNPRTDGIMTFEVTPRLCEEYAEMESKQFEGITPFDKEYTYCLFGKQDDLVNCYDEYMRYYNHALHFEGGHRLNSQVIEHTILPIIKDLML